MFYRKCGSELPEDSLYCTKCGERILFSIPPPQQTEQSRSEDLTHFSPEEKPTTFKEHIFFLFKFSGRLSRKPFILNILVVLTVQGILGFIVGIAEGGTFSTIALCGILLTAIPQLSLGVRRMRDSGLPLFLIPLCFVVMVACNMQAHHYTHKAVTIHDMTSNRRHKPDNKLTVEVLSYIDTASNYRMVSMGIPLLFLGLLVTLPSRERKT